MERFVPADEVSSQMGSGVDPANQALMQALSQIRQAQAQPLLSSDPLSQLGVGLQGFAAGYRGEQNPAVQQAMALRQQQLGSAQQGFQNQLGMANLGLHTQDALLRQRMEERRVRQETETEQQRRASEIFKTRATMVTGLLGLAKDNPLLAEPAMREMEAMYKQAGIPTPQGGFGIEGMRDLATQSKKVGTALMAYPEMSDAVIASSTGVTPEAVAQMRVTLTTQGSKRDELTKSLWGWTSDELAADKEKLSLARANVNKAQMEARISTRLLQLETLPSRTPPQEAERIMLQGFGKAPHDERDLARVYMEREGLPLELAIPKAVRVLAEAKKQTSDFDQVVNAIQAKNPTLSRGEAVLTANAQTKSSKADFTQMETSLDTMKDFMSRLHQLSDQVNLGASGFTQGPKMLIRYGMSFVMADEALASLQRKAGELANVMRFLGERGVISDRDIVRGQLLLPSIWTSGPVARDSIRELEGIVKTAESNLAKRRAAATQISGPAPGPQPGDPLGIR